MHPIGVFDSGYGGLTILKEFVARLQSYDFVYLGDNARAPYGNRSYETVYTYTLEAVEFLFQKGCQLVILACNTSSSKALRTIQQRDLPRIDPSRRVLGVIRPTVEMIDSVSATKHVGILGTAGTVASDSYLLEIRKLFPHMVVVQEACPMWVPLVENEEIDNPGTDYFVEKHIGNLLRSDPEIDTILLGCTHYPLLAGSIKKFLPERIKLISQDSIVGESLVDYLKRHPEIESRCSRNGSVRYFTTDSTEIFDARGSIFFGQGLKSEKITF